jgi:hypothetical protein
MTYPAAICNRGHAEHASLVHADGRRPGKSEVGYAPPPGAHQPSGRVSASAFGTAPPSCHRGSRVRPRGPRRSLAIRSRASAQVVRPCWQVATPAKFDAQQAAPHSCTTVQRVPPLLPCPVRIPPLGSQRKLQAFLDAGGGTRTPNTRIMIPARFGLAIGDSGLIGHAVGHNRMSCRTPFRVSAASSRGTADASHLRCRGHVACRSTPMVVGRGTGDLPAASMWSASRAWQDDPRARAGARRPVRGDLAPVSFQR